ITREGDELAPSRGVGPAPRVEIRGGLAFELRALRDAAVTDDALALEGDLDAAARLAQAGARERSLEGAIRGVQVAIEHLDLAHRARALEPGEQARIGSAHEVGDPPRIVDRVLDLDLDALG